MKHKSFYFMTLLYLFVGGLAHANFVVHLKAWRWASDAWHFWQIFPIVLIVYASMRLGWVMMYRKSINYHNKFGYIGRFLAGFAMLGLGYIIGLEML